MSGPEDPWADPRTRTEPGAPYAGPPPTPPVPPYGAPPHGNPYGTPSANPYGGWPPPWPGWGWPPQPPPRPRRPGQVIAAAVLAFVQAALVLFASLYVYLFASVAGLAAAEGGTGLSTARAGELATEGQVLALVQVLSVVALVVGGILALSRATRTAWLTLLVSLAVQVLLALYWAVRLADLVAAVPGSGGGGGVLVGFSLFFAAVPATGLGLLVLGPGRRWFAGRQP